MNHSTFFTIFIIFDLCIVITQSAESGDDRNDPRNLRSEEIYIRRKKKSAKEKRVRISQNEEMSKRGCFVGESSLAGDNCTGEARMEYDLEDETSSSKRRKWTNEEYGTLLRIAYTHYDRSAHGGLGAIDWKSVAESWHGNWNLDIKEMLRTQLNFLQRRMRKSLEKFDNEGIKWPRQLNDDLLKIYFATEEGDVSEHAKRIYTAWLMEHPNYKGTPDHLFRRAETMLFSVLKFDLANPRGKIKPNQHVDWKPRHNKLLQYLWHQPRDITKSRKQQIFDDAVQHCSEMQYLDEDRVYTHAKALNLQSLRMHERTPNIQEGHVPDATQAQYHSFMDDQNFSSLDPGTRDHHVRMASMSSQPGPSHSQPDPNFDLNAHYSERQSPDTNLYLGHRDHKRDDH